MQINEQAPPAIQKVFAAAASGRPIAYTVLRPNAAGGLDPSFRRGQLMFIEDHLNFLGANPLHGWRFAVCSPENWPIETHIAEKLHAYTMPRTRPNSRVKDLPDLALLASAQELDAKRLHAALEETFAFRKTHPLPGSLPVPAEAWRMPYEAMAREDQLRWATLDDVTGTVKAFLDPVLGGGLDATWLPAEWRWR